MRLVQGSRDRFACSFDLAAWRHSFLTVSAANPTHSNPTHATIQMGFYNLNVISRYQLAKFCMYSMPFFPMAWHAGAAAVRHHARAQELQRKGQAKG